MTGCWLERVACVALLTVLVSCTSTPPVVRDGAPRSPPADLSKLPEPKPTSEPKSRYGNHSPYVVLGRTYHVLDRADGYRATGNASWYGTKFQGRPTSSGERYDMYKLTAAHRNLPIPSFVRVTNLENHRSTIVRVNDRGPFHGDRLIDLSYAAAVKLGFESKGTTRVLVEAVTPGTIVAAPVVASVAPPPAEKIFLQAGAFSDRNGAERLRIAIAELIGSNVHIHQTGRDTLFRVRVGPLAHMAEANRIQRLIASRYDAPLIVME